AVPGGGWRRAEEWVFCGGAGGGAAQLRAGLACQPTGGPPAPPPGFHQFRPPRRSPDSLSVAVKEREPAALVALGDLYLVDSEGRPFKKIEREDPADLPLITGLAREQFVEAPEKSRLRLCQMLAVAAAYAR